jgi:hypothetical protein
MLRGIEDVGDAAPLHDPAQVHDGDLVGDLRHHTQIVRDEQHRHPGVLLELRKEVEDARLGGDVEGSGRLVSDEQRGLVGQGDRDHHALAHAARELEGIGVEPGGGLRDADPLQLLDGLVLRLVGSEVLVEADRLHQLRADGVHRGQGGHRLLEHHADLAAAHRADLLSLRGQGREVERLAVLLAAPEHAAALDPPGLVDQSEDRSGGDGLAAPRFADQAHGPAAGDIDIDPVHGPDLPLVGVEGGPQPGDREDVVPSRSIRCDDRTRAVALRGIRRHHSPARGHLL